jgi:tetratricopeptide (TPR) repeat protein
VAGPKRVVQRPEPRVSQLHARGRSLAFALLTLARPLAAQLPEADAAFRRGDRAAARTAYERVLATDSLNVTALYRVAILDSWDGQLARSLERFARLRRLAPGDVDIMVSQATVLGWAGRVPASKALYDSVLARSPRRADALAGQARAVGWGGDLERAERLWRAALELHPDSPELLFGLAQTLYWRGRPGLAATYAARARRLAPGDTTLLALERGVRAALRPGVETTVDGAGDSEHNNFVAQEATFTTSLVGDWRGALHAGWRRATLDAAEGASYGGGGDVIAPLGAGTVLRAGLGVRRLDPLGGPTRTPLTAQLGVDVRLTRNGEASIGYGRAPFDETAALIARGFVIDGLEASLDLAPSPAWSFAGTASAAWLSDGNRRFVGTAAALVRVLPSLQLGPFARILSYRADLQDGYFAPDRFSTLEVRLVYAARRDGWGLGADGGVGSQQVFVGAAHQTAWHFGFTLSRAWGANNQVALVGAITNSAAATNSQKVVSESYRYRSLGLRFQQGL